MHLDRAVIKHLHRGMTGGDRKVNAQTDACDNISAPEWTHHLLPRMYASACAGYPL